MRFKEEGEGVSPPWRGRREDSLHKSSRVWPSREGGDAQARFNGNLGYLMHNKGAWQEQKLAIIF